MGRGGEGNGDAIWVPVTINLPLGIAKSWTPDKCAPMSLLCGPYAIILLAQTANTVLVPVLPFLVKEVGASAVAYGVLQSTMWTSQTVLSPVLGWLSDKVGRRPVILFSLLVSAGGNALLAFAKTVEMMWVARVVSGLGFQIALFRAYFADSAKKEDRAGKFGLIGVIQGFSLFGGPSVGGFVAHAGGKRMSVWLAVLMNLLGAFVCLCWRPDEKSVEQAMVRRGSTANLSGESLQKHNESRTKVMGVKMVKLQLDEGAPSPAGSDIESGEKPCCHDNKVCRCLRKTWKFMIWLAKYDLYPLLSLNFFFRFAFAAYKSVFAFFCMANFSYTAREVGYLLSGMGMAGIGVQGVLVRLFVKNLGEERTLAFAMVATSLGFIVLSYARTLELLLPALTLVAIGYGLAVPCLTSLFAGVPVEQGIMQGIAGAIDRFGQAFGPIIGGIVLKAFGESNLMMYTGIALAAISSVCLIFVGEGCFTWIRQCGARARTDGYQSVSAQEEIELEEKQPLTGTPHEGKSAATVVDGLPAKAPVNGQMQNGK